MNQISELQKGLIFHASLDEWSVVPGPLLTSGSLVSGRSYLIVTYNTNDDFTNVGAASNATGIKFVATGTTPTHWDHASVLREQNYGYVDQVSKAVGIQTATYNVPDRQGSGSNRYFSFNGSSDYVSLPNIPAFGTGDFTVIVQFNITSLPSTLYAITGGGVGALALLINSNGTIKLTNTGGSPIGDYGQIHVGLNTLIYKRTSNVGTLITDITNSGITDNVNYTASLTLGTLATYGTYYPLQGSISMCRIFNYTLTPTQIANYSRPEYPIEAVDRITSTAELIGNTDFASDTWWSKDGGWSIHDGQAYCVNGSGHSLYKNNFLTVGKKYNETFTITHTVDGSYLTMYSGLFAGAITTSGVKSYTGLATSVYVGLVANTSWSGQIDNYSVKQAGCCLDLSPSGLAKNPSTLAYNAGYWLDLTNNHEATVVGATPVIPPASNLGATYFNGSSSYLDYGVMNFLPNSNFTISVKFRCIGTSGYHTLLTRDEVGKREYTILINMTTGQVTIYLFNSGGTASFQYSNSNTGVISPNIDYTLTYTFKSGLLGQFYINGLAVTTTTTIIAGSGFTSFSNTARVIFGLSPSDGTYYFNGRINSVKYWSRVLDADENKLLNDTN